MVVRKRLFFPIMRVVGLFIGGLVVAVAVAFSQVDLESLRGNVVAVLQSATGQPVQVDGAVSWKFSLRPKIQLNQVRIANPDWAKHDYAFSAERIDVTLNLVSLFRDRPTIQNIKIYDATVCVEKNVDGKYSMSLFSQSASKTNQDANAQPAKYPISNYGLGGVEVKNLVAHILDNTYAYDGLSVRYIQRRESREYAGWIKSDSEHVFPFIVNFSEYNAERKIYPMRIALSTGGDALIANVALEGTSKTPIDFIVKGDVPDAGAFGDLFNINLKYLPAFSVNMAGGFDRNKITLRKSSIAVRGIDFTISGDYDWGKTVPSVNLNVSAGRVDLMQLFPNAYGKKWIRPNRDLNVFKDIPLYGDVLYGMNMAVVMDLDALVVYRDLSIDDIKLNVKLRENHGRIELDADIADGDIEIAADVSLEQDGHMFAEVGGIGERIYVGEILSQVHANDLLSDLPINFEMYVRADGKNLAEIMNTITGPVQLYSVAPGYAHSALVSYVYGADFLTSLRHSIEDLFSSESEHNQIKVSCAALNAKLRDGRLETEQGFAIETNAINMRLAGNLDLGGESMRLALTTVPVRGIKLSLTGKVVNSIEVSGSLAEPSISISGAAVASKVASATGIGLLLAPFTGGIGLVAGAGVGWLAGDLLENWLADVHPCETAMKRGAPTLRGDPEWMGAPMAELVGGILNNTNQEK